MLSRSTGCRQKTLQVRQSACRWITITTCLFIHIFICVFIFSLHCEGDKKCWLRQWHSDTRKHLLSVEVVSLWCESWYWAGRQWGNWLDCLLCLEFGTVVVKTKASLTARNQVLSMKGIVELKSCVAGPLCLTDLVSEGSYSPLDGKQQLPRKLIDTQILFAPLPLPREALYLSCKALREHVQPHAKNLSPTAMVSVHPILSSPYLSIQVRLDWRPVLC